MMHFVELLYVLCALLLGLYGLHHLELTLIYLRHRHDPQPEPPTPVKWPRVTVQLPIYNEMYTAERLLATVARLDYPRHRLEIQVLDDSTDATRELVAQAVRLLQKEGLDIAHITRQDRAGFKAGALAAGLVQASGELIAIFDADFLPDKDFLRQVVPHFGDPAVGCIQARWGHVNRDYSLLTQAQAMGIDGHFIVQQTGRSRAGLFLNFNGTAGMWRRACIEDADGWQGDTLTEDLDLSYRAQLRGWRIAYLPHVVVRAELPAQISAFKRQQARWAQGSIQTALKLMRPLFRSQQPWRVKLEAAFHLTGYLVHPLMLMVILLTLPMSASRSWVVVGLPWLMITAVGPPLLYIIAQLTHENGGGQRLRYVPLLTVLGMGLSLNNTGAVMRAVLGVQREFQRTPKFDLRRSADMWVGSVYALRKGWLVWLELALAVLTLAMLFLPNTRWTFAPWLVLYASGFGFVAGLNLFQTYQRRRWLARQPMPASDKRANTPPAGRHRIRAG